MLVDKCHGVWGKGVGIKNGVYALSENIIWHLLCPDLQFHFLQYSLEQDMSHSLEIAGLPSLLSFAFKNTEQEGTQPILVQLTMAKNLIKRKHLGSSQKNQGLI